MIQRIQTVYLFIALLISAVLPFVFPLWTDAGGKEWFVSDALNSDNIYIMVSGAGFFLSALLSLIAIFMYKNRKAQVGLNRLNIVLNFLLLGAIVYLLLTLPGEAEVSEKGIGSFLPLAAILFLALANKAIIKDEKLVKSVDRLR